MTLKNVVPGPGVGAKVAPAGKVACLLCGGFISVSGGDRARFVDHMSNEHDAKTDCHDILLAACVLDTKETGFLVKSTSTRLDTIGRGKTPNYTDSFLTKITQSLDSNIRKQSAPGPPLQQQNNRRMNNTNTRVPPRQPLRNTGTNSVVRRSGIVQTNRGTQSRTSSSSSSRAAPVTGMLTGNSSISVVKVDMRRNCSRCNISVPNPKALIEHMNRNHFNLPGGVNIAPTDGGGSSSFPRSFSTSSSSSVRKSRSVTPSITKSIIETVKCPTCNKSIEKSKFLIHKMSHTQERKISKASAFKNSSIAITRVSPSKEDDTEIEVMDVMDDDDSQDNITDSDNECDLCNKKLATAGALLLHRNTEHGENNVIDDNPEQEEMKGEIDKLETLELLDNLVNFLQEE